MSIVGSGVIEIRVHADGEFRVFYVAKFEEAVYVLHVFLKKTGKTSLFDIELGGRGMWTFRKGGSNENHKGQ